MVEGGGCGGRPMGVEAGMVLSPIAPGIEGRRVVVAGV
jgi:hypothetical protein